MPLPLPCRHCFDEFVVHQRQLSRYISIRDMLQMWFWQAPLHEIKRGNVADLITYGFWYKSRCVGAWGVACGCSSRAHTHTHARTHAH